MENVGNEKHGAALNEGGCEWIEQIIRTHSSSRCFHCFCFSSTGKLELYNSMKNLAEEIDRSMKWKGKDCRKLSMADVCSAMESSVLDILGVERGTMMKGEGEIINGGSFFRENYCTEITGKILFFHFNTCFNIL